MVTLTALGLAFMPIIYLLAKKDIRFLKNPYYYTGGKCSWSIDRAIVCIHLQVSGRWMDIYTAGSAIFSELVVAKSWYSNGSRLYGRVMLFNNIRW